MYRIRGMHGNIHSSCRIFGSLEAQHGCLVGVYGDRERDRYEKRSDLRTDQSGKACYYHLSGKRVCPNELCGGIVGGGFGADIRFSSVVCESDKLWLVGRHELWPGGQRRGPRQIETWCRSTRAVAGDD